MALLNHLLEKSHRPVTVPDLAAWRRGYERLAEVFEDPFDHALACAFEADRLAWVVASGYEGALRSRFDCAATTICSLCVTEAGGNGPGAIETRWDSERGVLNGTKTFATLATAADRWLVLAARGEDRGTWKDLVLLEVDPRADGVSLVAIDPTPFTPELPHARIIFKEVATPPKAIVAERAWDEIKAFRFLEDVFVLGCAAAWFIRLARNSGQKDLTLRFCALVEGARAARRETAGSHHATIALAGLQTLFSETVAAFDWSQIDSDTCKRWERDRRVLDVASRARDARLGLAVRHYDLINASEAPA